MDKPGLLRAIYNAIVLELGWRELCIRRFSGGKSGYSREANEGSLSGGDAAVGL